MERGVPATQVDGGFESVGWYDFDTAQPRAIAAGHGCNLFARIGVFPARCWLAFQPLDGGRVADVVRYRTWHGPQGAIYALGFSPR